ncbi:hypothetical protein [Psychromicrobium xiongbiense]|uniref:hypothetical protein n=1 Tax=Psychromicrobium xiongbiense TaxID=3051184 RepID=UPI00255441EB|nr:hypothetical protein [Psychromicrobium sp. YIM S02556]
MSSSLSGCATACTAVGFVYTGPYQVEVRGADAADAADLTVALCLGSGCTPRDASYDGHYWSVMAPVIERPATTAPDTGTHAPAPSAPSGSATGTQLMYVQITSQAQGKTLFSGYRTVDYTPGPSSNGCPTGPATPRPVMLEL